MTNSMLTCNEVIILLDCHRGYNRIRHEQGSLAKEVTKLQGIGLIEKAEGVDKEAGFDWTLTTNGTKLVKHLLNETQWSMVFTPGSTNV